jgi:hypothetical protein
MDIQIHRVSSHRLTARIERDRSGFVTVIPELEGCALAFRVTVRTRSLNTANRLVNAIEAGVALTDITAQRDLFGEEYLASNLRVRMHSINADLSRLGFK